MKLSKTKTFRLSETQHKTLVKMKSLNVDVGRFIREAIAEKIEKEHDYIVVNMRKPKNNFERQLLPYKGNNLLKTHETYVYLKS